MRKRADRLVHDDAFVIDNLLEFGRRVPAPMRGEIRLATDVDWISRQVREDSSAERLGYRRRDQRPALPDMLQRCRQRRPARLSNQASVSDPRM
jgi:hypothetical protein